MELYKKRCFFFFFTSHRSILHIATTLTPFEMFIGGKKITRIDLMKPKPVSEINTSHYKNGLSLGTLFPNDQFVIREHRG